MIQILTIISPLFLIIFAGALLQKTQNMSEEWQRVLNDFALKIGFPVLIFSALAQTSFSFIQEGPLLLSNSLFLFGSLLFAIVLGKILRLTKEMSLTLILCCMFGNVAYLGIPVLTETSGEEVLSSVSLIVAVHLFWIFTAGIGYLEYFSQEEKINVIKKVLTNLIKNPLLIAVLLGIFVTSLNIQIPEVAMKSLDMITASVTPVVLIVIGLFIGSSKVGNLKEWIPVFFFSLVVLMVLPAGFYFGAEFFGYAPSQFAHSITEAAMPLAITPFALAEKYKLKKKFIARSIVLSTILSVITLPFWISLTLV